MTAVWVQIGMMPVKQSHGTDAAPAPSHAYELDVRFLGPTSVETTLKQQGRIAKKFVSEGASADAVSARFQSDLAGTLTSIGLDPAALTAAAIAGGAVSAERAKQVANFVSSGMITPAQGVDYGELVAVMDVLRKHLILNLGVVPVRGDL
jgi:hypothetical protein